jgi:hypothetical protein
MKRIALERGDGKAEHRLPSMPDPAQARKREAPPIA